MNPKSFDQVKLGRVTEILKMLVSTPSINPFDGNGEGERVVAGKVEKLLREAGFDVKEQEVINGRYNVIGTIGDSKKCRRLLFNGHMDTVDVRGMTEDPFSAAVDEQGFLHGRGSVDMKGGLAAMLAAAVSLAGVNELNGELTVAAVVDEEYLGRGTQELVKLFSASGGVVGEPTALKIGIAHKGVARYTVNIRGKAAHGSSPENGIDAIAETCKFISEIYRIRFKNEHQLLGKPVIHTSMINGGSEWSTIPGNCTLWVERRTIPGETDADIINEALDMVQNVKRNDAHFSAEIKLWKHFPPMEVSREDKIVKNLLSSLDGFAEPEITGLPYWTDAATMNMAGIPTVVFGPGNISFAHSDLEKVSIDEVHLASLVYYNLAKKYLNGD
ncbi:MAG: M20 family metallopeptidase [Nitrososphaeria archaeon]